MTPPADVLLDIQDLHTHFDVPAPGLRHKTLRAVDGISLTIRKGEALGLVGESGSGKSTVARSVLLLEHPTSGRIRLDGIDLASLSTRDLRSMRRRVQMVFQDPYASLNPRMRVVDIVAEPFIVHDRLSKAAARIRSIELLERVGLPVQSAYRYPHEFSGGQRQRVGVARAIALSPDLIVADEPVSALDVSIQAQLLNLLRDLQTDFNLTYLFISHDLSVVRYVCDRIAIMYLGQIVEEGANEAIFNNPQHPYTQALLSAIPVADPTIERDRKPILLPGEMPSPLTPPQGLPFPHSMPGSDGGVPCDRPRGHSRWLRSLGCVPSGRPSAR